MKSIFLFFVLSLLTGCSSFLYYPAKEELVDRNKMPLKPKDIQFTSQNGAKLHGWTFDASRNERSCAIVFFHGNAQNLSSHFFNLYEAPNQGYSYMIFDYEGYGTSEGRPSPQKTVEDGRAAIQWMHDHFPNKKVIVFGQSLGGAIALRSALDMKSKVPLELIVVDSTFASYRSAAKGVMASSWITYLLQPLGWLTMSDEFAPGAQVANLSPIPLVVIHGSKDAVVNIDLGKKLYAMAAEPKQFWEIPNGTHTDFMFRDHHRYATRFFDELDKHCPVVESK